MISSNTYYKCYFPYYISLETAAHYSGIPIHRWLKWIQEDVISTPQGIPSANNLLPNEIKISLGYLPKTAAEQYLLDNLLRGDRFCVDFVGFLSVNGRHALFDLLNEIVHLKKALLLQKAAGKQATAAVNHMTNTMFLSRATLYRKEAQFMSSDLSLLIQGKPLHHSRSLCALSEHYIAYYYSLPNAHSQAHILRQLAAEALQHGDGICNRCPFNPDTTIYQRLHAKLHTFTHDCLLPKHGMLVPDTRYPVNRFIRSLSKQNIAMGRNGYNAWADQFLHKTLRDRPPKVNSVWFGDHHIADVMVIIGFDKSTKEPILARPWLTVVTDAASEAIIGSVVSVHPNSQTIAESFCRAAAFTVSSPFYGLPEVFYIDRGKDYRSTLLEGRDDALRHRLPQNLYLNRALADHPLLPALNVTVHHALPRTGRSKVIERVFGTITREYFQSIPGWVGNSPANRPYDFDQQKKDLLSTNSLWTLDQFAVHWFETIIPAYNEFAPNPSSKTPLQLYQQLPRANTITPDWNTLSIFMVDKSFHKVHTQGIKYKNEFYWHPFLRDYIGEEVQIYDFDQSFCHSISVLSKGKYICQAEPLVHQGIIESDRLKLIHHLEEQKQQKQMVSQRVSSIKLVLKSANIETSRYTSMASAPDTSIAFAESIDLERDATQATVLSPVANTLATIRDAQIQAIDSIVQGPEESPITDYYIQKSKQQRSGHNDA